MDHGITTCQLIRVLCQSFYCTTILDIVWSHGVPQFMSSMFHQFSQQWGHHITLTCSSAKVKVMVKFTKILSKYHGVGNILTKISSVRHCCNTGTLLSTEMAYPHYYDTKLQSSDKESLLSTPLSPSFYPTKHPTPIDLAADTYTRASTRPCWSTRLRHPPRRYFEDPNWNWLYL